MNIEMVKVADLIPYVNNARVHSDEQVTQIASSIKEFGFNVPILIDPDKGVIAGHGRLMAAKKLGIEKVPTIKLGHLTDAQKKAYILADNKIALNSKWDDDLLKLELESLSDDVLGLTGFSEQEINLLFDGWSSDIDVLEKDGQNTDGIMATIKIGVSQEEKEFALEKITNALDQAGIDYEFK